ncbi:MAG: Mg2 transporter protein CorA family protein [Parcubacteria group bacterium GW2011_GWA1_50_14]|nr:MAG: Mg2 transporter protein CorA family protein [Parcubacteria group bacterium GW2011_GWA1_50_14]
MKTTTKGTEWINLVRPSGKEVEELGKKYKLHRLIIEELKGPSARPFVENHKSYLYFIYQFPIYDPVNKVSRRSEMDFIITKKEVITVSYNNEELIREIQKSWKPEREEFENTLQLAHKLLESILAFQERQLTHIREKVDTISAELFRDRESQRERALLEKISYLKRDISQYRIIVRPQRHTLESLSRTGCDFLGEACQVYMNDLIGENIKILDQLEDYREAAEDFEDTNNQLIGVKNAQVVKTFTILAFLTFPMMLFAALFSMNTKGTPIIDHPQGFWIVLLIMILGMVAMFAYFRRKDWI